MDELDGRALAVLAPMPRPRPLNARATTQRVDQEPAPLRIMLGCPALQSTSVSSDAKRGLREAQADLAGFDGLPAGAVISCVVLSERP
jgi:hypothetical protein